MTAYYRHGRAFPEVEAISRPDRTPSVWTRMREAIAAWRRRVRESQELQGMSCADLRDIGITRADVGRVFRPEFAREYARRGPVTPARGNRLR